MKMFNDLDERPYTGEFLCSSKLIKVKIIDLEKNQFIKSFFSDDNKNKIKTITPDKIYHIVKYEVMGDVADVCVINDNNEEEWFMEDFFEEV